MLPVALSPLVPEAYLMGMNGVQAPASTTANAITMNSRMPDRPLVGPGDCGQITPRAQDRVKAAFVGPTALLPGARGAACDSGVRRPEPLPPPRRPAGGQRAPSRRNRRSTREISDTS